jgi:hypothetical protein
MATKAKKKAEAVKRLNALQVDGEFITKFKDEGVIPLFTQYAYIDRLGIEGVPDTKNSETPRLYVDGDATSVVFSGKGWDCYYYGLPGAPEEDEINDIVSEFESDGNMVYAAHIMDTFLGRMLTLLYVSDTEGDWEYERRDENSGIITAVSLTLGDDALPELGNVGIYSAAGRLFRFV